MDVAPSIPQGGRKAEPDKLNSLQRKIFNLITCNS